MALSLASYTRTTFIFCCLFGLIVFTLNNSLINDQCKPIKLRCIQNGTHLISQCNCTFICDPSESEKSSTLASCECIGQSKFQYYCNTSTSSVTCIAGPSGSTNSGMLICDTGEPWQNHIEDKEQICLMTSCQEWSEWTNCTSMCNGGSRQRTRFCPTFTNDECLTKMVNDTAICNTEPCPTWSQWSAWSTCSLTCNSGTSAGVRTRTRACPKPNACGNGTTFELDPTPCYSNVACPSWTQWEQWSPCSRTCGRGDRKRQRQCSSNDSCMGSATQVEPCFDIPCPFVSHWSAWSPCTVTCGGGTKTRSKLTCVEGPPTCPSDNEQASCNAQPCPQWNSWEPWTPCSKTCGAGQRYRKRTCPIEHGCVGRVMQLDKIRCNDFQCPTPAEPNTTLLSK